MLNMENEIIRVKRPIAGWIISSESKNGTHSKLFPDSRYGGKEASRNNAKEYMAKLDQSPANSKKRATDRQHSSKAIR